MRGISRILLISLRNTFRKKRRLALTLFTLGLGGAIFIAVFNVQVSLNLQMERTMRYFLADVNLSFDRIYRIERLPSHWNRFPASPILKGGYLPAEKSSMRRKTSWTIYIICTPIQSDLVDPLLMEGRWLLPEDENAITVNENSGRSIPDLHPGDTLH